MEELLRTEGFGADDVTDLFYVNYKSTDLIGHSFNMVEPEERDALEEQDRQLAEIVRMLDDIVGRGEWVMTLTADHGMTPYPSVTGGWSIVMSEMGADIEREFGTGIFVTNRGYQVFLDKKVARRSDVTAADVARFIRNYTVEQNARGDIPEAFADRSEEKVFLTAVTPKELKEALDCARES
jgi:predicted AlkP superfamily pyrophosphatase or phosphodiesterase